MPTEVELRTRVDDGVEIIYTRRAVIQGVPPAMVQAAIDEAACVHDVLKRYNFFNDSELIFASDTATVTDVDVTTTYAPVEETP